MYICIVNLHIHIYYIVVISKPPDNMTVHRGNDVTIHCGYQWPSMLPVTWVINGISFGQSAIMNSSSYQLNNPSIPSSNSLIVYSINDTTTFQCIVHSTSNVSSTNGTITVITGM